MYGPPGFSTPADQRRHGTATEATRRYLRGLTRHLRLTFESPRDREAEPVEVLLLHGSPHRINECLFEDRSDDLTLKRRAEAGAEWRKRKAVQDAPIGPKNLRSAEEEAVVAFRHHTLLPLDDCLGP